MRLSFAMTFLNNILRIGSLPHISTAARRSSKAPSLHVMTRMRSHAGKNIIIKGITLQEKDH